MASGSPCPAIASLGAGRSASTRQTSPLRPIRHGGLSTASAAIPITTSSRCRSDLVGARLAVAIPGARYAMAGGAGCASNGGAQIRRPCTRIITCTKRPSISSADRGRGARVASRRGVTRFLAWCRFSPISDGMARPCRRRRVWIAGPLAISRRRGVSSRPSATSGSSAASRSATRVRRIPRRGATAITIARPSISWASAHWCTVGCRRAAKRGNYHATPRRNYADRDGI